MLNTVGVPHEFAAKDGIDVGLIAFIRLLDVLDFLSRYVRTICETSMKLSKPRFRECLVEGPFHPAWGTDVEQHVVRAAVNRLNNVRLDALRLIDNDE